MSENTLSADVLEAFERAFSSGGGGCRRMCVCGRVFYNPEGGWDWDEGELEELESSKATPLDYTVGTIILDGDEFVMACHCWHYKARNLIGSISSNAHGIARFLSLEKERKQHEADQSPTVSK